MSGDLITLTRYAVQKGVNIALYIAWMFFFLINTCDYWSLMWAYRNVPQLFLRAVRRRQAGRVGPRCVW